MAFVFVYTREAHPGEHVGHHVDFDTKLANARLLSDRIGIRRPILVDDLDGTLHRAYGSLPNMTWVIARGGTIAYKADWTSAANIDAFLDRFAAGRSRKPPGGAVAPYRTEQTEYRDIDRDAFDAALERNGPRALAEFRRAEEIWAERR